jgi:Proton-conducting membrane transporter
MKPRKYQRASGAAYFLVLVVLASASLLLANRFTLLYPLTPERTSLIDLAVFFLAFGLGLLLGLFPFHLWMGPMTDDAPLPISAMLLALGQPIGLWLLFRLLGQYSWLSDKSNLFDLIALGGAATAIVGGVMAAFERRAGRLLGYAAMFTLGLALLDLSRATQNGLAYSGMELAARALGLCLFACAVTINRAVEARWVQRVSLAAFLLAGLSLAGIRLGVSFSERWNLLAGLAGTNQQLLGLLMLAHVGVLVGIVRLARGWSITEEKVAELQPAFSEAQAEDLEYERELVPAAVGISERMLAQAAPAGPGGPPPAFEPAAAEVETPASPNGNGAELHPVAPEVEPAADEYVFEEHVRQIARVVITRARPYIRRMAHTLPLGTRDLLLLIWRTWPVWASIGLLLGLTALLLAFGAVPQLEFGRIQSVLGTLPFVQ